MDKTERKLLSVIESRLGVTPKLSAGISELDLDSIKIADFVRELEDEFGVRFDQDVFEVETIAELAAYIRVRLAESSSPS